MKNEEDDVSKFVNLINHNSNRTGYELNKK